MRDSIPALNQTLTTPAFYVLLALVDKTLHGYGIRDQVAYDSDSLLILPMGTIYPLLKRLVAEHLLEQVDLAQSANVSRGKAIVCRYRITLLGRGRLEGEVKRLERVTGHARYKLGGRFAA